MTMHMKRDGTVEYFCNFCHFRSFNEEEIDYHCLETHGVENTHDNLLAFSKWHAEAWAEESAQRSDEEYTERKRKERDGT